MGATQTRFLIANGLLLGALAGLFLFGGVLPSRPVLDNSGLPVFTLDRGGLLRFNNGKTDVETAYRFNLDSGATQVPQSIGDWTGTDFPLNLEAVDYLRPELLVNRIYQTPRGDDIFFTVIGSSTSRKLHRPEVCYAAADWTLTDLPVHDVALDTGEVGLDAMRAYNTKTREDRLILYWYLWRDERRRIEDGAFVIQVASPINGATMEQATATAERFVRQILHHTVEGSPLAIRIPFVR